MSAAPRPLAVVSSLVLAALLLACNAPGEAPGPAASAAARSAPSPAAWTAITATGRQEVALQPRPDPIPLNQPFELLVRVVDAAREPGRPLPGAELSVTAWMPSHGHGMNRRPYVVSNGDGTFLVRGMLFHMSGLWQIGVDVIDRGVSATATFDVTL